MKTNEAIREHLKYGLIHVDGLCWLCDLLVAGVPAGDLTINLGGTVLVRRPTMGVLQNAVAESGLIYCRKLLDFLGLKGQRNSGALYERAHPYHDDTIGIEDLGLPRVPIAALGHTPFAGESAVRLACEHTIRSANKGVAHFTEDRGERGDAVQIGLCARVVTWLVQENVYNALGEQVSIPRPWTVG